MIDHPAFPKAIFVNQVGLTPRDYVTLNNLEFENDQLREQVAKAKKEIGAMRPALEDCLEVLVSYAPEGKPGSNRARRIVNAILEVRKALS